MVQGGEDVEDLKKLISAFAAELDTPTMPYINEGLLEPGVLTEMSDSDRAAGKPGLTFGHRVFDAGRATELRWEATSLKRSGHYLESAEKIIEAFRLDGNYDLVNIRNLWKTTLCGGDARGAVALIRIAVSTYERYEIARRHEQLPYPPQDDLADVLEALKTEQSCESRLRAFSGNPGYVLPRPYQAILADLQGQGTPRTAPNTQPASQKSSDGCYIATAVYGSHDAAEVTVLRRYRDEHLQQTAMGRHLVSVYYACSPALARHLPRHRVLSAWTRRLLDAIVEHVQASGRLH